MYYQEEDESTFESVSLLAQKLEKEILYDKKDEYDILKYDTPRRDPLFVHWMQKLFAFKDGTHFVVRKERKKVGSLG